MSADNLLKQAILYHAKAYPLMTVTDAVKIVYQSVYGPSHLIKDEKSAFDRLINEYNSCEQIIAPIYDPLGNGLIRVNLNALDHAGITPKQVFDKFIATANAVHGTPQEFEKQLAVLSEVAEKGVFTFSHDELQAYLEKYRKAGYPPMRHSEEYRQLYKPAYRVVVLHHDFILGGNNHEQ